MVLSEILVHPDVWDLVSNAPAIKELLSSFIELSLSDERTNVRRYGVISYGRLIIAAK